MEHPRTETPTKEALLKTITFAVPCYNSAAYMDHCVETLLACGEDIEILLVDDGSAKDDTAAICDRDRKSVV